MSNVNNIRAAEYDDGVNAMSGKFSALEGLAAIVAVIMILGPLAAAAFSRGSL